MKIIAQSSRNISKKKNLKILNRKKSYSISQIVLLHSVYNIGTIYRYSINNFCCLQISFVYIYILGSDLYSCV